MQLSLNDIEIRFVKKEDTTGILEIYKPFILDTVVSFEIEVPSVNSFWGRIDEIQNDHPYLVAIYKGEVCGYAYSSPHRGRYAYQWTKEISIYLSPNFRGIGLGKKLYLTLLDILKKQGIQTAVAGITVPNEPSEAFHLSFGFRLIGTYPRVGFKKGKWQDVSWYNLPINDFPICDIQSPRDYRVVSSINKLFKGISKDLTIK